MHLQYHPYSGKNLARLAVLLHKDYVRDPPPTQLLCDYFHSIHIINIIYVAKKTGKMFFVSYNMPKDVQIMQEFVERKITDRLKSHLLNSDQTSK